MKKVGEINGIPVYEDPDVPDGQFYLTNAKIKKESKNQECDMRCQWAYQPVWKWCVEDCICVCKGVNHAKYTYWADPENVRKFGNSPERVL